MGNCWLAVQQNALYFTSPWKQKQIHIHHAHPTKQIVSSFFLSLNSSHTKNKWNKQNKWTNKWMPSVKSRWHQHTHIPYTHITCTQTLFFPSTQTVFHTLPMYLSLVFPFLSSFIKFFYYFYFFNFLLQDIDREDWPPISPKKSLFVPMWKQKRKEKSFFLKWASNNPKINPNKKKVRHMHQTRKSSTKHTFTHINKTVEREIVLKNMDERKGGNDWENNPPTICTYTHKQGKEDQPTIKKEREERACSRQKFFMNRPFRSMGMTTNWQSIFSVKSPETV